MRLVVCKKVVKAVVDAQLLTLLCRVHASQRVTVFDRGFLSARKSDLGMPISWIVQRLPSDSSKSFESVTLHCPGPSPFPTHRTSYIVQ